MRRLRPLGLSLRTRLTLWYGLLLGLTLVGFSALVYVTLEYRLSGAMDDALHLRADQIRRVLGDDVGQLVQPENIPPDGVERRPLDEFAAPGIYVQVINSRGGVVYAPSNLNGGELPIDRGSVIAMRQGREVLADVPVGGETNVRVLTVPILNRGQVAGAIQVGQSLSVLESTMSAVARQLATAGALALLLATVVGWLFTRQALRPLAQVTHTARHIATTGDYQQRLPLPPRPLTRRADELSTLASTFNDMIARLEHVLESQRRLLADTSHELRNPLTVIRGNLALLRRATVSEATRQEAVQEAEEEAARMSRLIGDLLLLARADAGQLPTIAREPVDLGALAADVVERLQPAARARSLALAVDTNAGVVVEGDRDRLRQLTANLLENAQRYTPEGGSVRVAVRIQPPPAPVLQRPAGATRSPSDPMQPQALLVVQDSGIGIAAEHLPHLFERFYRVDKARTRADGGTGLGLAIAQYIAQAHGGRIEAASAGQGQGSTFTLYLPLASTSMPRPVATPAAAEPAALIPAPATPR